MKLTTEMEAYRKQMEECSDEEFVTWYGTGMKDVERMHADSYKTTAFRMDWSILMTRILRDRLAAARAGRS